MLAGLLLAALLVGQVENQADDPDARRRALQVRRLVRLLDDDDPARRGDAEKQLTALGPEVLDLLPQIGPGMSAEVKERLARVRRVLESQAVEAAVQASRVTLKGEMPLVEVLAKIEQQTGNKVVGAEGRQATIKADFDDVPFWVAIDQVLDQAGLNTNRFGGFGDRLTVTARPDEELPRFGRADYGGVFRCEATRVQAVRDLRNPQISGLRLALDIGWEPRVRPISLEQPLDKVTALDEQGRPLAVNGIEGELRADVQGDIPGVELEIPFQLPDRSTKKIASLDVELTAMVPGRVETFQFDSLDKATDLEQRRAGVTVVLQQARKNVDAYEIRLRIKFDEAANALESHRSWIFRNETYLIDKNGAKIEAATYNTTAQETNEIGLAYLYVLDAPLGDYKLVYRTPAAIIKKPVKFSLKDISLP